MHTCIHWLTDWKTPLAIWLFVHFFCRPVHCSHTTRSPSWWDNVAECLLARNLPCYPWQCLHSCKKLTMISMNHTMIGCIWYFQLQTAEGLACRLRVHIGSDNLVCFEAVNSPGQYLGISNSGTACISKKVKPDQIEAKFFVRVQVRYFQSFRYPV